MVRTIFILLMMFFLGNIFVFSQDESWKYVKEEHGIKVFTKEATDTPLKEVKVQMLMHTTLSALITLINDAKNHPNWSYATMKAEIIKRMDDFSYLFYAQSETPWPITNRDMVALITQHQDSISKVVTSVTVGKPDYIPEVENFVRVPELYTVWTLTPQDGGDVLVDFIVKIDIGGNVPTWFINLAISKGPFTTLLNMPKELEKPEYKNAHVGFIKE